MRRSKKRVRLAPQSPAHAILGILSESPQCGRTYMGLPVTCRNRCSCSSLVLFLAYRNHHRCRTSCCNRLILPASRSSRAQSAALWVLWRGGDSEPVHSRILSHCLRCLAFAPYHLWHARNSICFAHRRCVFAIMQYSLRRRLNIIIWIGRTHVPLRGTP